MALDTKNRRWSRKSGSVGAGGVNSPNLPLCLPFYPSGSFLIFWGAVLSRIKTGNLNSWLKVDRDLSFLSVVMATRTESLVGTGKSG
jgi:hypothetical protein